MRVRLPDGSIGTLATRGGRTVVTLPGMFLRAEDCEGPIELISDGARGAVAAVDAARAAGFRFSGLRTPAALLASGRTTSEAQREAAVANGAKGGRPKKGA